MKPTCQFVLTASDNQQSGVRLQTVRCLWGCCPKQAVFAALLRVAAAGLGAGRAGLSVTSWQ